MFFGVIPIAFNRFCNQLGEGLTVIPEIVTPAYRGDNLASSTLTSIFKVLLSTLNLLTEGVINSVVTLDCNKPAFKSRATPIWLMASARFGVKPISKTSSTSMLKTLLAGVPGFKSSAKTIIPS